MNKEQYLLTCLMEECAELSFACSKAIRFGMNSDFMGKRPKSHEQINIEINDVQALIHMLHTEGFLPLIPWADTHNQRWEKEGKVEKWMQVSRELGIVDKE